MNEPTDNLLTETSSLYEWQVAAHHNAVVHGWWVCPDHFNNLLMDVQDIARLTLPEKIALIQSEFDEAFEANYERPLEPFWISPSGKPEGWGTELVDVLIRIFDLAGAMQVNLAFEISKKIYSLPADATVMIFAEACFKFLHAKNLTNNYAVIQSAGFSHYHICELRCKVSNVLEEYRRSFDQSTVPSAIVWLTIWTLAYIYAMYPGGDFTPVLKTKHEYNMMRPPRHGGLRA